MTRFGLYRTGQNFVYYHEMNNTNRKYPLIHPKNTEFTILLSNNETAHFIIQLLISLCITLCLYSI